MSRQWMTYEEFACPPQLAPWVANCWYVRVHDDAGQIEHLVPPRGGAMLSFAAHRPPILTGPRVDSLVTQVSGGDEIWGVHLWPGTVRSLLGVSAVEMRGCNLPATRCMEEHRARMLADALVVGATKHARIVAVERALTALLPFVEPLDDRVMDVAFQIMASGGELAIAPLAEASGLSERQLRRRFRAAVGLGPKELTRVCRCNASMFHAASLDTRWIEIACRVGYADQAHLTREYRRILGHTPRQIEARLHGIDHHFEAESWTPRPIERDSQG